MKRWKWRLLKFVEKLAGRFYEGQRFPERLNYSVLAFAQRGTNGPTQAEWVEFAMRFGMTCYHEGYVRGFEHVLRGGQTPIVDAKGLPINPPTPPKQTEQPDTEPKAPRTLEEMLVGKTRV